MLLSSSSTSTLILIAKNGEKVEVDTVLLCGNG